MKPDFLAHDIGDSCYGFKVTDGLYCIDNCQLYHQFYTAIDWDLAIIAEYDIVKKRIAHIYYGHPADNCPKMMTDYDMKWCRDFVISHDLDFTLPSKDFYEQCLGYKDTELPPYTRRLYYLIFGLFTEERFLS